MACTRRLLPLAVLLSCALPTPMCSAALLADSISVAGDSISRGYDANTSLCNYGDNVSRVWAAGDTHGSSFCSAGSEGTFSHAERLECAAGRDITNFNDAASGADMRNDFFNQASSIRTNLSASPAPRYAVLFLGHNDACTNTTSKTGNSCSGDFDPNNYCRTTNAAFEREFRRGMDELIQIPSVRILSLALARISQLCNFGSKATCGLGFGLSCGTIWGSGQFNTCKSLTIDCSSTRRIDMYNQIVAYNEIIERVTLEYAAIPAGGVSAGGAVKAADVAIRFSNAPFYGKFSSGDVSCCDCFHPDDVGQQKLADMTWFGLPCSTVNQCCGESADTLTNAKCDLVDTTSFYPSGFWPAGPCGNGILDPGEQCDDGNTADGDCCSSTCQFESAGSTCQSDGKVCTNDVCDGSGTCTHPNNTAACDDGDACTQTDTCQNGTCVGANPVTCSALDQCHLAGTCNPATGMCSNPSQPNNTACNDGDACTQTDTCQNGACVGANPVTCSALDQCHLAGTCNPATGVCSNPSQPNNTACNDGDACTQTDTCQNGACVGANPVACNALDQCHLAGTCNPATGVCSNPSQPNNTACSDGNACTQTDTCQNGACVGANPVTCSALDQCHLAGTCNPATGMCSNPSQPNNTACNDGDACTQTDTCQNAACVGANPVTCSALDQCHLAGTCNPATGMCSNPSQPNNTACSDGNACTQTDTCQNGACVGANPVICSALDQCHLTGTCNPATGMCSNPNRPDDTTCDDGNACTRADRCLSGVCTGDPHICGDGLLQPECGEGCDHGSNNGTDGCCSANCTLVDGDGDGLCDRDDPCTGPAAVVQPKLVLRGLNTTAADDRLGFTGMATLPFPFTPALDPLTHGVRVLITDTSGTVLDVTLPGGSFITPPSTGWKVNRARTTWTYVDRSTARRDGIYRVALYDRSAKVPGQIKFVVRGRGASYPVPPASLPLTAQIIVDPPAAVTGQCGAATFLGPPPAPHCAFNARMSVLTCK